MEMSDLNTVKNLGLTAAVFVGITVVLIVIANLVG